MARCPFQNSKKRRQLPQTGIIWRTALCGFSTGIGRSVTQEYLGEEFPQDSINPLLAEAEGLGRVCNVRRMHHHLHGLNLLLWVPAQ